MAKTFRTFGFVFFLAFSSAAFADEGTAPQVVAPGQPASAQALASTGTTTATAQAQVPQQGSMLSMMAPFAIVMLVMYFLMIRPQQKKQKQHQEMMSTLKQGDEVVTSAGIIGRIAGLSEKVVTLEVSDNVKLRVLKSQVNQIVKGSIAELQA
jgi:preprotein translocase subunit YajC